MLTTLFSERLQKGLRSTVKQPLCARSSNVHKCSSLKSSEEARTYACNASGKPGSPSTSSSQERSPDLTPSPINLPSDSIFERGMWQLEPLKLVKPAYWLYPRRQKASSRPRIHHLAARRYLNRSSERAGTHPTRAPRPGSARPRGCQEQVHDRSSQGHRNGHWRRRKFHLQPGTCGGSR